MHLHTVAHGHTYSPTDALLSLRPSGSAAISAPANRPGQVQYVCRRAHTALSPIPTCTARGRTRGAAGLGQPLPRSVLHGFAQRTSSQAECKPAKLSGGTAQLGRVVWSYIKKTITNKQQQHVNGIPMMHCGEQRNKHEKHVFLGWR